MPVHVSERPLRTRLAVQPLSSGGYVRSRQPDPNDALPTYLRSAEGSGVGPNSGDRLGGALMARAVANRQAADFAQSTAQRPIGAPAVINTVLPDARWEGLKQALADAGVGRIRTGARAGMGGPGFFDTQQPRMTRAYNTMTPRERLLLEEMARQSAGSR